MKKLKSCLKEIGFLLTIVIIISNGVLEYVNAKEVETETISMPFRDLTASELTEEMGAGWNLGNTMDGHTGFTPEETVWQGVKTTKELIRSVHDMGFNTVRIPVTWGTMIDDENNYAIDEAWISRIQDIIDYCVSLDMYAIVNIHHDGAEQMGWLRIASEDLDSVKEKYESVWNTISSRFKDYDEHLIFESMNEVKGTGMTIPEENQVIMELNQIFVDTVRGSGSNNEKRWLVVTGKYNFIDSVCNEKNGFELPQDLAENRLIVSVHDYTTWAFCGQQDTKMTEYPLDKLQYNRKELLPLYETYTSKGIPVIVGEYGCINKGNALDRAYYLEGMNRIYQEFQLIGIYWDQGWYDRTIEYDYSFSIIDRTTGNPIEKEVTDAMMRGRFVQGLSDLSDIVKGTQVVEITEIQLETEALSLQVDEVVKVNYNTKPENTNDIVLWKSSDETVATVAYGKIHGKGKGIATITAYSQSGSVKEEIQVTITDMVGTVICEEIIVADQYDLGLDEYVYLKAKMIPENTDEFLYYRTADETIATVSEIGKILAVGNGTTTIYAYSSGGIEREIAVNVSEGEELHEVELALNVYYNDDLHDYYSNEMATNTVIAQGNGQYTLTFDCNHDLSEEALEKGVTGLSNLTAIYIKDYQVVTGKSSVTPLKSCNITYNSIVVDGIELTIIQKEPKSALKGSGIFDSNDPINAWDGSAIEEVKKGNNVANFTTVSNPKKIEVTFTLSDMVFSDGTVAEVVDGSKEVNKDLLVEEPTNKSIPNKMIGAGLVLCFILLAGGVVIRYKRKGNKVK